MNLVELNKILPTLISNREPVLLVGPPGCGKTTVVKDIAKWAKTVKAAGIKMN